MDQGQRTDTGSRNAGAEGARYWRFGAMIATSMAAMFVLMYVHTFAFEHVRWSETRFYMTFVMGAAMSIIMLSFMLGMYKSQRVNVAIFTGSLIVLIGAIWLIRSQATVDELSYMRAMIPHHSIAILTSERSEIVDVRVCELAVSITEAQRREIDEMAWLIDDIARNGPAETAEEARQRSVPDFEGSASRTCG